jgi:uncharacterized protein (DUF433 family)
MDVYLSFGMKESNVSCRVGRADKQELESLAALAGRSPSAQAALFVEEGIRMARWPWIEFRDGQFGREPWLRGTRLTVADVVVAAEAVGRRPGRLARELQVCESAAAAALHYAECHAEEIAHFIRLAEGYDFEAFKRQVPTARRVRL